MDAAEVTRLLEATRDDLVRDVLSTLTDFRLRRLTPAEIERVKILVLPHVHAAAIVATRYALAKRVPLAPPPAPTMTPEHGWTSEPTEPGRPSAMPGRRRSD